MKREIVKYVAQCFTCQQVKTKHQQSAGPIQSLHIPKWKLEEIEMDFVVGLSNVMGEQDAIWVVINKLMKSAHFIPIKVTNSMQKLDEIYIKEIVKLHGIVAVIVSYSDTRFTLRFWTSLHEAMEMKLNFNMTYNL